MLAEQKKKKEEEEKELTCKEVSGLKVTPRVEFFFFSSKMSTYLLCNQAHYLYMVIMTSLPGMFPSPTFLEDEQPRKPNSLGFA